MKCELPVFNDRTNICIICEGPEEYEYLNKLNSLGVWNNIYDISLDNAHGNGNIAARYQDRFQNGSYDMIFIFCDTDKKPYLGDISLTSPAKKVNAPLIKNLTGIDNYKAREDQRQQLMSHITIANFNNMLKRVNCMGNNDTELGSSNFSKLITYLTSENDGWIREIESRLEE